MHYGHCYRAVLIALFVYCLSTLQILVISVQYEEYLSYLIFVITKRATIVIWLLSDKPLVDMVLHLFRLQFVRNRIAVLQHLLFNQCAPSRGM